MRSQARHIGRTNNVCEEINQVGDGGTNGNLVFPFEFGPHRSKGFIRAGGGADVVHNVHVNVIEVDVPLLHGRAIFIDNGSKNVARFRGRNLDACSNCNLIQGTHGVRLGALDNLHVPHGTEFDCQIGKSTLRSVHDKNLQNNIIVVDRDKGFSIDRIRKSTELVHVVQLRRKQRTRVGVACRTGKIGTIIQVDISTLHCHCSQLSKVNQIIRLSGRDRFLILFALLGLLLFQQLKECSKGGLSVT
mmetsp:Transcript_21114/g.48751  ORF Transcript_21114/g.48751 Transcript_21114/m.48751 type:complete len:246 (-) Transcript_21114:662-1399(-)